MRFYFHVRDFTGSVALDQEGSDLADLSQARQEAQACVREFLADDLRGLEIAPIRHIEISNDQGQELERVSVSWSGAWR